MPESRPPRAHLVTVRGLLLAFAALLALVPTSARAAGAGLWDARPGTPPARHEGKPAAIDPDRFRALTVDHAGLRKLLADTPATISLPGPRGGFARFAVRPSQVMAPDLAADHPEIRTYAGEGVDDPRASVHLDVGPSGFHAAVRGPGGTWYIDPYYRRDNSLYVAYRGGALPRDAQAFEEGLVFPDRPTAELTDAQVPDQPAPLRTYRLALLTDPKYTAYHGAGAVVAAKVALVNRVNQIYEDDLGIRLQVIGGTLELDTPAEMTGANGPCGAQACFTATQATSCTESTLTRTRIVLGQLVGADAFDVGHLALGANGGGLASLAVVGGAGKAEGCTGVPAPVGDAFAVDYVAHELGHQFGAEHTFNGVYGNCDPSTRNDQTAVEPGSGSSVMAYAGICTDANGADDLQAHSDPYFSQQSLDEVRAHVEMTKPPLDEIQNVSLSGFGAGDRFRIAYGETESADVVGGENYSAAAIDAIVTQLTGLPVTVTGFLGGTFGPGGFQLSFTGGADPGPISVTALSGATAVAGTTQQGGPQANGGVAADTGNRAPTVTAPAPAAIPVQTPFTLTGSARDLDGDALTYLWEQDDPGTGTALFDPAKTNGPLFRQFGTASTQTAPLRYGADGENLASASPSRDFPDMAQVLAGRTNAATGACPAKDVECFSEWLPTSSYGGLAATSELHLRLTARDGNGGVTSAATTLTVVDAAGPFRVTGPAGGRIAPAGGPLTVTWDVNGTGPGTAVNAADVEIRLSSDGGTTFPTVLAASTPNDGTHTVTLPATTSARARIKVSALGNVFYDVSHGNFAISDGPAPIVETSPASGVTVQYTDAPSPAPTVEAYDVDSPAAVLRADAPELGATGLALTGPEDTGARSRRWTVTGRTTAPPGRYDVPVTVTDEAHRATTALRVAVAPETATVSYEGEETKAAADDATTAPVVLAARVAETSDGTPGDITTATVTFRRDGATLCSAPVGADGTASCTAELPQGASTVAVAVGGHYAATTQHTVTVTGGRQPGETRDDVPAAPPAQRGDPPAATGPLEPALARVARRPRVSRTGHFTVPVTCRLAASGAVPERCAGVVVVTAKVAGRRRTVARKRFAVAPGRTVRVRVRLTKAARRALRERRLTARLTVTVSNGDAADTPARRTLVLRRP